MKVILFSDLHIHSFKDFARTLDNGRNSRLQKTLDVLTNIRLYAQENDIRNVLFGGDLFHKKGVLNVGTYQAVYEEIAQFQEMGLDLTLLVGNHDQATLDGKTHAIHSFQKLATVVSEPKEVTLQHRVKGTMEGLDVWCVPYMEDTKDFRKAIKKGAPADILLAHGGINGAVSGPVEYRPEEELEVSDIPNDYAFRFFGHYHRKQKMGDKLWYIGSPLQHSRGEADEIGKGFLVYDSETTKFKTVPLGMPEFMTWDYSLKQPDDTDGLAGNYVDVLVDPDSYDLQVIAKDILKLGAEAVNPIPVIREKKAATKRLDVDPSMAPRKLVEKYIREYAPDELDEAELIERANKYLEGT